MLTTTYSSRCLSTKATSPTAALQTVVPDSPFQTTTANKSIENFKLTKQVGFAPDSIKYRTAVEVLIPQNQCIFDSEQPAKKNERVRCLFPQTIVFGDLPPENQLKAIFFANQIFEQIKNINSSNYISKTIDISIHPKMNELISELKKLKKEQENKWNHFKLYQYSDRYLQDIYNSKVGNCNQLCSLTCYWLSKYLPEANVRFCVIPSSNHVFLSVNGQLVIDPWNQSIFPINSFEFFRNYLASATVTWNGNKFHLPVVTKVVQPPDIHEYIPQQLQDCTDSIEKKECDMSKLDDTKIQKNWKSQITNLKSLIEALPLDDTFDAFGGYTNSRQAYQNLDQRLNAFNLNTFDKAITDFDSNRILSIYERAMDHGCIRIVAYLSELKLLQKIDCFNLWKSLISFFISRFEIAGQIDIVLKKTNCAFIKKLLEENPKLLNYIQKDKSSYIYFQFEQNGILPIMMNLPHYSQ